MKLRESVRKMSSRKPEQLVGLKHFASSLECTLPPEILEKIFMTFDPLQINICSQVCQQWYHFCTLNSSNNPCLIPKVIGRILVHLDHSFDILTSRAVCKLWKYGVDTLTSKSVIRVQGLTTLTWWSAGKNKGMSELFLERIKEVGSMSANPFPSQALRFWFMGPFSLPISEGGHWLYLEQLEGFCSIAENKGAFITQLILTLTRCKCTMEEHSFGNMLGTRYIHKSLRLLNCLKELNVHTVDVRCEFEGLKPQQMGKLVKVVNGLGKGNHNCSLKNTSVRKVALHTYFVKEGTVPDLVVGVLDICPQLEVVEIGNTNTIMKHGRSRRDKLLEYISNAYLPKLTTVTLLGFHFPAKLRRSKTRFWIETEVQKLASKLKQLQHVEEWDRGCCPVEPDSQRCRCPCGTSHRFEC